MLVAAQTYLVALMHEFAIHLVLEALDERLIDEIPSADLGDGTLTDALEQLHVLRLVSLLVHQALVQIVEETVFKADVTALAGPDSHVDTLRRGRGSARVVSTTCTLDPALNIDGIVRGTAGTLDTHLSVGRANPVARPGNRLPLCIRSRHGLRCGRVQGVLAVEQLVKVCTIVRCKLRLFGRFIGALARDLAAESDSGTSSQPLLYNIFQDGLLEVNLMQYIVDSVRCISLI